MGSHHLCPKYSWFLTLCLLALTGCGGGGGGGSSTAIITSARVNGITVEPAAEGTVIHYSWVSSEAHSMGVAVFYSDDRGISYRPATVSGPSSGLSASAAGTPHEITWLPMEDLATTNQGDLRVRIVPTDEITGGEGTASSSDVFSIGHNLAPTVASVTTPAATVGGEIDFFYSVLDPEEDVVAIELEYSVNGGVTWLPGTAGSHGDGTQAVHTSVEGEIHLLSWFAQADAPNTISGTTLLRITALDVVSGVPGQSLTFSVNLVAPLVHLVTLDEIPESMNGSQPLGAGNGSFMLNVPFSGFEINVEYDSLPSGADVDPTTLRVTSTAAVGAIAAGDNLASLFDVENHFAVWIVTDQNSLSTGIQTLTASVRDTFGNYSNITSLPLRAVATGAPELPFNTVDRWFLDFGTDFFDIDFTPGDSVVVTSTLGANGISDFREDITILGLRSENPTNACEALGSNGILFSWAKSETLGRVRELFGGSFDASEPSFSPNLKFTLNAAAGTSAIRIGGDDEAPGFTLGRAAFDYRNAVSNNNRTASLGVFTTNLIEFYINTDPMFRARFDNLIPGRGTPAGEHTLDVIVLDPSFDRFSPDNSILENIRYDEIYDAIDALARICAVIASHEIGHSIGLVANGNPPAGLFGGVHDAPFADPFTNDYHLDTTGFNLMASALNFSASLISGSTGYRFNGLNEAYLSESTVLGN